VIRPLSFTPGTAAMRPLMVADPILRAGNPEIVPASYLKGCCCAIPAHTNANAKTPENKSDLLHRELKTVGIFIFKSPLDFEVFTKRLLQCK
jgi:hypothetical protein